MKPVQASASLRDATVILDDRPIIRSVTLDIAPGLTVIRGPNGAGKTTLLRAIVGLAPLARGERTLTTESLYIGHRAMLLRGLTARENLSFYLRFRGLPGDAASAALARWGLQGRLERPVEQLSAGERRRVALARIETETVPLVLLDEPFADLDEQAVTRVRETVARLVADGRSVVVATHAHHEIDAGARIRIVMEDGAARAA